MKYLTIFEEYKSDMDKFLHSGIMTDNTNPIDLFNDYNNVLTNPDQEKAAKEITRLLKGNINKLIKLYHGTSPHIDVLEYGLKTTKMNTKKSIQSEIGYVYLSIFPDMAKTFGNLAYGISNAAVYEVLMPIVHLKPDKDQLFNVSRETGIRLSPTLGNSAIYGHGFRVKGNIPPYMINKYNI